MADRPISELTQATQIFSGDYFVLEQNGEAKRLSGEALRQYISRVEINSIEEVWFDSDGRCHVRLTDGEIIISQSLHGRDGTDGEDAPVITNISIDENYHLIITLSDETSYDAGYCRGASGAGTGDMLSEDYDPNDFVATAGGIPAYITERYNPSAKTAEMTQEVGKDEQGKLWTNPAPQGNFLPLSGGTMTGAIAMDGNGITGLSAPTNNADAATKQYVDQNAGGIQNFYRFVGYCTDENWADDVTYASMGNKDYFRFPVNIPLLSFNSVIVRLYFLGYIPNVNNLGAACVDLQFDDGQWEQEIAEVKNPSQTGSESCAQEEMFYKDKIPSRSHANNIGYYLKNSVTEKSDEQFGLYTVMSYSPSVSQLAANLGTARRIVNVDITLGYLSTSHPYKIGYVYAELELG